MKKIYLIIPVLLAALLINSCSEFLEQEDPNQIAAENYFTTENDVLRALNSAYLALRSGYCLGEGSLAYTEERSDNIGTLDNQSNAGDPFAFTDFSISPANPYLKNHWNAMFTAITRSNFVLSYIEDVPFSDESLRKNYKAEAKFLRALVYFHVVRKWGDVPLVTKYLTTPEEVEENTFREKKEVVYDQIVTDLTEALDNTLPDIQPASGKGRACKASINMLLGQAYLTMATTLQDDRQANLASAKQYLQTAYAMRKFGSLTEIPYEDVFNVDLEGTCPELIFQIPYIRGNLNYHSSIARSNQARNETINSQYQATGNGRYVNLDVVKEYEEGDLRGTWSVKFAEYSNGYMITKFRDRSDEAGTLGYGGNDWILMRYADLILMLAEVEMLLGNETAAIAYLDEVRARAGMPSYDEMQDNADYAARYPTLKLAILHERRVELAFENHRWYDLLRYFSTDELITFFHSKKQEDYGISNMMNFGSKDIYYPIPFDEHKLNPEKMYQNPGY